MEINLPTASPFFTGISNQIMYCISTPNLPTWNTATTTYGNGQQKKPDTNNSTIVQPQPIAVNSQVHQNQPPAPPQYYYGAPQNPNSAFNQTYPAAQPISNDVTKANPNYDQNKDKQSKFYGEGRNFECAVCHKKFRQKGTLQQHERIHLDSRPYECTQCNKKFRQRAILNQHIRIHCDASAQLIYKNLGINNGTLWPSNVPYPDEIRSDSSQGSNGKETTPQIVHSVFGGQGEEASKDENKNHQKQSMPLFVRCPICQQEFKQKSTLVQRGCIHIESRPYSCLVINCGKRFRQQSHLQQHNRIHQNLKPYACPYQDCHKYFRQQTILNQHIRVHTGIKPYRCKTCFKEFRQQAILSQHEKSHMNLTLGCPLTNCKRRFVNEHDLRKHIEQHMNPPKQKKPKTNNTLEFKPENAFVHPQPPTYPPLYFNASIHQPRN